MKDEFGLLRLLLLLSMGGLVFAVVIRACQEAASQRARFEAPASVDGVPSRRPFPIVRGPAEPGVRDKASLLLDATTAAGSSVGGH